MNLSRKEGDRYLRRLSEVIEAETGRKACLPKSSSTLIDGCCRNFFEVNHLKVWEESILPEYFDEDFLSNLGHRLSNQMRSYKAAVAFDEVSSGKYYKSIFV